MNKKGGKMKKVIARILVCLILFGCCFQKAEYSVMAADNLYICGVDIGIAPGQYMAFSNKYYYKGIYLGATQCFGFARWCQYKLFGSTSLQNVDSTYIDGSKKGFYHISANGISRVPKGALTESKLKTMISAAKPGAHLRTIEDSKEDAHSIIITNITDSGFSIAQCNGSNNQEYSGNYFNRVGTYTYTWSSYINGPYGSRGIDYIEMPYNYPYSDPGTPQSPSVNEGTNFYAYIINTETWLHLTNDDGCNVTGREGSGNADQIWLFTRLEDGSYKIASCKDGRCLEVHNFESANGTNVETNHYNGNTAQRWNIYGESANYKFKALCGENYLDLAGGTEHASDGTNIQMWEKNDSAAQKFQIWKLDAPVLEKPVVFSQAYMDDNGNNIKFTWNACNDATGYDVRVFKEDENEAVYTYWNIRGNSYATSLPPGKYQVTVAAINNKFNAWQMGERSSFEVLANNPIANLGDKFSARIKTFSGGKVVSEISGNIAIETADEKKAGYQIWKFQRFDDGSYTISSSLGDKCIDLANGNDSDGANVLIWKNSETPNQKWYIYQNTDGSFYFRSACSNTRVMEVAAGKMEDNTNIQLWRYNGWVAQKFYIEQCDEYKENGSGETEEDGKHKYDVKVTKEPKCTEEGIKTYTCSVCGDTYTEPIAKKAHQYSSEWTIDKEATYSSEGSKSKHCIVCGAKTEITAIPKLEEPVGQGIILLTDASGPVGSTVDVYMHMTNNPGVVGATLIVDYDKDKLQLISCEDLGVLNDYQFSDISFHPFMMNWEDPLAEENNTKNGNLARLKFKILDDLGENGTELKLSIDTIYDVEIQDVQFKTLNGMVTIKSYIPGDINNDGLINSKDSILCRKYILGGGGTINMDAADVNRDGKVNSKDSIILRKYILGGNVILK